MNDDSPTTEDEFSFENPMFLPPPPVFGLRQNLVHLNALHNELHLIFLNPNSLYNSISESADLFDFYNVTDYDGYLVDLLPEIDASDLAIPPDYPVTTDFSHDISRDISRDLSRDLSRELSRDLGPAERDFAAPDSYVYNQPYRPYFDEFVAPGFPYAHHPNIHSHSSLPATFATHSATGTLATSSYQPLESSTPMKHHNLKSLRTGSASNVATSPMTSAGNLTTNSPLHLAILMSSAATLPDKKRQKKYTRRRLLPRSKNGCWICRIKHLKCDEVRPSCASCLKFGIDCDYSSEKPPYVLDKDLRKEKLMEITKIRKSNQTLKCKRKRV